MRDRCADALGDRLDARRSVGFVIPRARLVHGVHQHVRMVAEDRAQPPLAVAGGEKGDACAAVEVLPLPGVVGGHDDVQHINHGRGAHDGRDMAAVQR